MNANLKWVRFLCIVSLVENGIYEIWEPAVHTGSAAMVLMPPGLSRGAKEVQEAGNSRFVPAYISYSSRRQSIVAL